MTDALKNAAEEASAATGLEVVLCDPDATDEYGGPLYSVEVYDNIDGEYPDGPVIDTGLLVEPAALAYLEGLEAGARIATVRHAELVDCMRAMLDPMGECIKRQVVEQSRQALAELGE